MSKVTRAVPNDVGFTPEEQRQIAQCTCPGDMKAALTRLRMRGASDELVALAQTLCIDALVGGFWSAHPEMTFEQVLASKGWLKTEGDAR